jgi:hypothetical protein
MLTAEIASGGVLLRTAAVVARNTSRRLAEELQASGVSLTELMKSSRKARAHIAASKYGGNTEPKPRYKRS